MVIVERLECSIIFSNMWNTCTWLLAQSSATRIQSTPHGRGEVGKPTLRSRSSTTGVWLKLTPDFTRHQFPLLVMHNYACPHYHGLGQCSWDICPIFWQMSHWIFIYQNLVYNGPFECRKYPTLYKLLINETFQWCITTCIYKKNVTFNTVIFKFQSKFQMFTLFMLKRGYPCIKIE
jgi:hypothetical protein